MKKSLDGIMDLEDVFEAGHIDASNFIHTSSALSELNLRRIKKVTKDGGNRLSFANDNDLQLNCFKGKDNSFKDTLAECGGTNLHQQLRQNLIVSLMENLDTRKMIEVYH